MSINEKYFDAPVFESLKSTYVCRYQSRLEFELMKRFEAESKIKSFHQPLLVAFVKESDEEKFIYVDFWIEYANGKIDLLFIERGIVISDQAKIYVLSNTKELLKPGNFSFATINRKLSRFRRIAAPNLVVVGTAGLDDFYFVNFKWVN